MKWLDRILSKVFRKKIGFLRSDQHVESMRFEFLFPGELEPTDLIYVASEEDKDIEVLFQTQLSLFEKLEQKHGVRLVYLPLLVKQLQEEKVLRYRAPYLKDDEVHSMPIGNNFLLRFLKNPEDRGKMKHGLLRKEWFSLGRGEKDGYFVRFYPLSSESGVSIEEQLSVIFEQAKHELLSDPVISRYNCIVFDREIENNQMRSCECRAKLQPRKLEDMLGSTGEEKRLESPDFQILYDGLEEEKAQRSFCPSIPKKPRVDDGYADRLFNSQMVEENTDDLMEEIKVRIKTLRQRGIAESILEQLFHPDDRPRKMVITKDYQIQLPEFNNMEIKMEPLVKAVYLLFLNHPEGIMFKNLPDYRNELTQIYQQLRPNGLTERARQSIEDVTNPLSNSINEKCARIRGAFLKEFDKHIARFYYIDGMRATPKNIAIPRDLVVWE